MQGIKLDGSYAHAYRVRGHAHFERSEYAEAIADYNVVLGVVDCIECRGVRARAYGILERWEDAIKDLEHLMDIDPETPKYYWIRGLIRSKLKRWRLAAKDFDTFITKNPANRTAIALQYRGAAYSSDQVWDKALDDFTQSLKLGAAVKTFCLRGRLYCCMRDWDHALADFEQALCLDPSCEEAKLGYAHVCIPHNPLPLSM